MPNSNSFIKHTLIFGIGGVIMHFAPVLLFPLYTNYLTPGIYGTLDILYRTADIINTVLMVSGIRLAALTFFRQAESEEERRRVAVTVTLFTWALVTAAILLTALFAGHINLFLKLGDTRLLLFGLTTAFLDTLIGVPLALTQARLESVRYIMITSSMLVARVALCVYFIAFLKLGIWGALGSQFIVTIVFGVLLTIREARIGLCLPDLSKLNDIIMFSLPFIPVGILFFFYTNADRYFVLTSDYYAEPKTALAAIGLYVLAERLVGFANVFGSMPMNTVWSAEMYDIYKQLDASEAFGRFTLRIMCVHTFCVLGICTFSTELILAICDNSYRRAIDLVPLFGVMSCLTQLSLQAENTFYITRKTYYKIVNNTAALPLVLLLMYILVPRYGIMGAAIALTITKFFSTVVTYVITLRLFRVKYPLTRFMLLFAVTAWCFWMSSIFGNDAELQTMTTTEFDVLTKWEKLQNVWERMRIPLAWKTGVMIMWLAMVWFTGILSREDKETIAGWIKRIYNLLVPSDKGE
ncbi:MAG: lipopolysaccharide biosynthesis protein [Planctomycetaceae bacterium]|jgi:O-antigen/teichoic acid export membrane protein|nr:lipopolysaccharide biosynthesis protein [Planctomycetaceae bacterium]